MFTTTPQSKLFTIRGTTIEDLANIPESQQTWEGKHYTSQCVEQANAIKERSRIDEQTKFDIIWIVGNAYRAGFLAGRYNNDKT